MGYIYETENDKYDNKVSRKHPRSFWSLFHDGIRNFNEDNSVFLSFPLSSGEMPMEHTAFIFNIPSSEGASRKHKTIVSYLTPVMEMALA